MHSVSTCLAAAILFVSFPVLSQPTLGLDRRPEAPRDFLAAASKPIDGHRVGPTAEQAQAFEQLLPARLELMSRVAAKFGPQLLEGPEGRPERFRNFMADAHTAPSAVLERLLGSASTVRQFGEGLVQAKASPSYKALGDDRNLTFVPVGPCRIADSREATLGKLNSGVARQYKNWAEPSQGGNAGCNEFSGVRRGAKGAIALTVTVVGAGGPGYLTLRPVGSLALTSVINFDAKQVLANSTVVTMTGAGQATPDFEIVPAVFGGSGQVHVVLDLLGFYVASEPTMLECNFTTVISITSTFSGSKFTLVPACATGFSLTGIRCTNNSSGGAQLQGIYFQDDGGYCEWFQPAPGSITYEAAGRCCRVPGQIGPRFP